MKKKPPTSPTNPAHLVSQEYAVVPIDSIKPHDRNANQGNTGGIYESISAKGFYGACIVSRSTRKIIAGSHRWMAAKQAGLAELPVILVDVSDSDALVMMVGDNEYARQSADDPNKLAELLTEILQEQGELTATGWDLEGLDQLIADNAQTMGEALKPEKSAKPVQTIVCPHCGETFNIGGEEE